MGEQVQEMNRNRRRKRRGNDRHYGSQGENGKATRSTKTHGNGEDMLAEKHGQFNGSAEGIATNRHERED